MYSCSLTPNNAETLDSSCLDLLNPEVLNPEINKAKWLADKASREAIEVASVIEVVVASEEEAALEIEAHSEAEVVDVSFNCLTVICSPWRL